MPRKSSKKKPVKIRVEHQAGDAEPALAADGETPQLDELLSWKDEPDDLKQIEQKPRKRRRAVIAIVVLGILFVVTAAGFFVFTRDNEKFSEQDVSLALDVPTPVTSGNELTVTITYRNAQAVDLRSAQLIVTWPEGFTVTDANPKADDEIRTTWGLGTISAGASGQVVVRGQLVGELDSQKEFFASLEYRPANFNSTFTTKINATTTIGASALSLSLDGPSRAVPDKSVTFTLTVGNTSSETLKQLTVTFDKPSGFAIDTADPKFSDDESWTIDSLNADAEQVLAVSGRLTGTLGNSVEVGFQAGVTQANGGFTLQNSVTRVILLVEPELTLELSLAGHEDGTAVYGDTLVFTGTYKNNSDFILDQVTIAAEFSGLVFDLANATADPKADLSHASDGQVRWTSTEVKAFAQLEPGDEGTLKLTVPLVDAPARPTAQDQNPQLGTRWRATTALVAGLGRAVEVESEPVELKVATTPRLTAEARYYDEEGAALGEGPLPPTVGQTTSYRVSWILSNPTNDLNDVAVTTALPGTVFWTGKVQSASAGTLSFDATTREVRWALNKVPAGTGTQAAQLAASFEVSITPTAADVGLLMLLSEIATLTGTDAFTNTTATVERPRLTTELENDLTGRGQGVVVGG
ncbi:MAG: hypothetical protein HYZ09_00885 [Candidatus Kerfeldbacteria bacterium]|nr:hypothetical protein [Candidatus Kerfeldbacteria bacterium]